MVWYSQLIALVYVCIQHLLYCIVCVFCDEVERLNFVRKLNWFLS